MYNLTRVSFCHGTVGHYATGGLMDPEWGDKSTSPPAHTHLKRTASFLGEKGKQVGTAGTKVELVVLSCHVTLPSVG